MNRKQAGFTLIELLVVIAIIGILAAVVLASLNDARKSGTDAAIKQTLGNARAQAEIKFNKDNFSYANVCTDTQIGNLMTSAKTAAGLTTANNTTVGTASAATYVTCHASASAWAIISPLAATSSTNATASWCVDSTGKAGVVAPGAVAGNDYAC